MKLVPTDSSTIHCLSSPLIKLKDNVKEGASHINNRLGRKITYIATSIPLDLTILPVRTIERIINIPINTLGMIFNRQKNFTHYTFKDEQLAIKKALKLVSLKMENP